MSFSRVKEIRSDSMAVKSEIERAECTRKGNKEAEGGKERTERNLFIVREKM